MKGLQKARKLSGLTQEQACDQMGIPLSTLRRWEQGVNEPDVAAICKMARFYRVSTDFILDFDQANDKTAQFTQTPSALNSPERPANESGACGMHPNETECTPNTTKFSLQLKKYRIGARLTQSDLGVVSEKLV